MESPEPGPPHGPWQLGNDAGYGCCYEHSARGTAGEDGARGPEHLPPLRPALSSSSSEGEPAAARRREPSLSDEAGGGYEFDSAESGTSLRYSTGGEGSEGAGLASSESGGSGFSLAASALPERKRPRSADGGGGRPRYEVVRELGPEEVRWLYREDRKSWKPFIGYDSLRLELAYRALGPGAGPGPPVCVRGGLYEVDVSSAECYPVYWQQTDKIPVMRGQWFIDGTWQPLEEEESNLIEQEHLSCFKGQQMQENFDMEVSKPVDGKEAVHSFKLSRNHVDWHSVDEVYLYSDATTSKIARTVTQKLGFSKASSSGTRLHRGYVEEATLEDKPSQTTHIVFVVHGIGQKMDQGRIIKNTAMNRILRTTWASGNSVFHDVKVPICLDYTPLLLKRKKRSTDTEMTLTFVVP